MFADIVSFIPTDPTKNYFTYKIPNKLSKDILIGHLVSIPWGKKTTQGIIVEVRKETNVEKPKEILKFLSISPLLLPNYIEILKWMSWYYHAPMLDCLKAMLPELPITSKQLMTNAKNLSRSDLDVKQTLVLVPTIGQIEPILKKINNSKAKLIYHKQLPRKEVWENWWKIYTQNTAVIVGTRSAVFVPCLNLEKIIIINEEDSGFKDRQSPYFDTLTVAAKLAQIAKAKLIIESLTPRVETVFKFDKKVKKLEIRAKPKVTIVDLRKISKKPKKSDISDTLRDLLMDKVGKNQKVLLFLNRIKESGQIYCTECKFSGFFQQPPEFCPNCKGRTFSFYSLNINSLKSQVSKLFPNAGINVITERKEKIKKPGKPVVTLATNAIFSKSNLKFSLIGIILADTVLNLPDFNSAFGTFATLAKLTQLVQKEGEVVIQTYNPEHSAIKAAANFEFETFYSEELILRKKLELPPFTTLAKLSLRVKSPRTVRHEAEKLKTILDTKSLLVEVSDPVQNWQGKTEFNIIAKAQKREELDKVLVHLPTKWRVEVDPESLL